jgi:hypothetical protein
VVIVVNSIIGMPPGPGRPGTINCMVMLVLATTATSLVPSAEEAMPLQRRLPGLLWAVHVAPESAEV